MAGKRHHHVWQMLQRGFSWRENNDDHVWVYSKEDRPKRTVTRKYGRINGFYGPEGSKADDNITDFENSTQEFIHHVRDSPHGAALDHELAAAFIAHLEMRSLFLRSEISNVASRCSSLLQTTISRKEKSSQIVESYFLNHPEMIEGVLDDLKLTQSDRVSAKELISLVLPEILDGASEEFGAMGQLFLAHLEGLIPKLAADAHNKALVSEFSETERAQQHKKLSYTAYRSSTASLILPDTSVAFITSSGCPPVTATKNKVELAIAPVSAEVAIVGMSSNGCARDEKTLQRVLASCAYKNFLAPQRSAALDGLSRKIGSKAKLISDAELARLVADKTLLNL